MKQAQKLDIADLFPKQASVIYETFARMKIAEEEISAARLTKDQGSVAFKALWPSAPLRGKGDDLYRAHAREICCRVKAGEKLPPPTDAELLAVMSDTSLKAPLNRQGQPVAEYLFARVFPEQAREILGAPSEGAWPGQVKEDIATMRRRSALQFDRGTP